MTLCCFLRYQIPNGRSEARLYSNEHVFCDPVHLLITAGRQGETLALSQMAPYSLHSALLLTMNHRAACCI